MTDQAIPAIVTRRRITRRRITADYDEYERTYAGFVKLTKWSIAFVAAVLVGLALII